MGIQMFDHAHSDGEADRADADARDEAQRERPGAGEGEEDRLHDEALDDEEREVRGRLTQDGADDHRRRCRGPGGRRRRRRSPRRARATCVLR